MIYLDTSAVLKLVVPDAETAALEPWIAERTAMPRVSSRLLRIELLRTVARHAPDRLDRAHVLLSGITLVSMDEVASSAEMIGDPLVRSLDAIHLATAYRLRSALSSFVTYDKRLAAAASALNLPVEAPAYDACRA